VLFKNEYKALLFEAQGNTRDYAILLTFLKSGIRESEQATLKLSDIYFAHDELRVREGEKGTENSRCAGAEKSAARLCRRAGTPRDR
jgi:integrase